MNKIIELNNQKYEIVKDYKEGFNLDLLKEKMTDYYEPFDYIFGDYSYDKLRLKGFNEKSNKGFSSVNDISKLEEYIKEYCSYECRYFLIRKTQ